jgi:hypothetical protein
VVQEAIEITCQNINSNGFFIWDENKNWDKYGIKVIGDREIINNPPALPAPKKVIPPPAPKQEEPPKQAGMYGAARRKDPVPEPEPKKKEETQAKGKWCPVF